MKAQEFKDFRQKVTLAVLKYASYTFNILIVAGIVFFCFSYLMYIIQSM